MVVPGGAAVSHERGTPVEVDQGLGGLSGDTAGGGSTRRRVSRAVAPMSSRGGLVPA